MRIAAVAGVLGALLAAAPAGAAVPGPTVRDFDDQAVGTPVAATYAGSDVTFAPAPNDDCNGRVRNDPADDNFPGPHSGANYLHTGCPPELTVTFNQGDQAQVSLYVSVGGSGFNGTDELNATALDAAGGVVSSRRLAPAPTGWAPVVLASPDGSARIRRVFLDTTHFNLYVDDVGYSPFPQPDTDITAGPSGTTSSGDASFSFQGNQGQLTFRCALDGGRPQACSSTQSYTGLADGQHTFTVAARDRWGTTESTPATRTWTIDRTPPPPPPDRDADGVLDSADNCPDAANADQGDADGDGIGNACEVLPSGTIPPEAGRFTTAKVLSGEVFVKLPPGAASSAFTASLRVPFQDAGFLPLKGVAAIPVGSTIDTRRGSLALTAAINGRKPGDRRQLRREAQFAAGIFAIRQKRAKRSTKKKLAPQAVLTSAPGAEAPCARTAPSGGPVKGVRVRSLVTTAKGLFRTVGGASTATPAKGRTTFITSDGCDGTRTEVGRGRVAVVARKTGKRRVVRAGRAFFVKAQLFAVRKGRRG